MNELDAIRRFRASSVQADPKQDEEARARLMALIEQERRAAVTPKERVRGRIRRGILVALAVGAIPAGYAVAQNVVGSSEVRDTSGAPAALECPEADAAFQRANVEPPEFYAGRCPTAQEVATSLAPTLGRDRARIQGSAD